MSDGKLDTGILSKLEELSDREFDYGTPDINWYDLSDETWNLMVLKADFDSDGIDNPVE